MPPASRFWLVKSEPESFSIDDLAASPRQTTCWDGVRNYQARNFLRDDFRLGDRVMFYHSNAAPPAVVGVARVVREAYPDHTSWDPADDHYDPSASPENPIWQMVDLQLEAIFPRPLTLDALRTEPGLAGLELLRKGSRLSVQPVSPAHFALVLKLAERTPPSAGAREGSLSPSSSARPVAKASSAPRARASLSKRRPAQTKARPSSTRRPASRKS